MSADIHIHDFGLQPDPTKDTVLWIHGYTLTGEVWQETVALLPQWNHLALDLPGHGKSAMLKPDDDLQSVAESVVNVIKTHSIKHLVGLSFGGIIAMQAAIILEDELDYLVLAASGLGNGPINPHASERNMALLELYQKDGAGQTMTELWLSSPPDIFTGAKQHPVLLSQLTDLINQHSWQELDSQVMQQICNYPQDPEDLEKIEANTLILVGEEDMPEFKRISQLIRRSVDNCTRKYIEDTGHLCLLERPDLCAPVIAEHFGG